MALQCILTIVIWDILSIGYQHHTVHGRPLRIEWLRLLLMLLSEKLGYCVRRLFGAGFGILLDLKWTV